MPSALPGSRCTRNRKAPARYRPPLVHRAQRGFTVLELLIALVIATLVLTIATPNFSTYIANRAVTNSANRLLTSINSARQEAVTRGIGVALCQSADGASCGSATDWSNGWIVKLDDGNDTLVAIQDPLQRVTITGPAQLAFRSRGYLMGSAQSFAITANAANRPLNVCINRFGLARVQQEACS